MDQKKHFLALDGLRGIAAIVVVIFHFFEFVFPKLDENPLGHGYLAVDFFFCLSGFVIGYAYDDRVGKIGYTTFFKNRLIRLHPLVILGTLLGISIYLLDPWALYSKKWTTEFMTIPFFQSLFLIPTTIEVPNRYGNLFPFNPPAWSLFMEYVSNIFYIVLLWKMPRKWLPPLLIIAAGALLYTAHKSGYLVGGWNFATIWEGAARVGFSFLAGLTVHRYRLIIQNNLGFIGVSLLLLLTFGIPYFKLNWLVESLIVILVFPLITALGAGTSVHPKFTSIVSWLGKISYPLYMCHYWFISAFGNYFAKHKPSGDQLIYIVIFGLVGLIIFSDLAMRLFDEPVRKWLSKKSK